MNRTGPDHEHWVTTTGAYVLGALPGAELVGFEAHLDACPACREEVAELHVAAEALPASAPSVQPPPALKARVMAEVEREAALLRAAGAAADRPVTAPRRRTRWTRWAPAAAAAVLAAGVLALALGLGRDAERSIPLTVDKTQAASARGELRVGDGNATLVVAGLPEPGPGRVYQIWLGRPGRAPKPTTALFVPAGDGRASTGVTANLGEDDAVLVTSEPSGGSRAPTRPPVLSAQLR
jgi:anti-sigma-K factor RskA